MAKRKPYTYGEKQIFNRLALALLAAEIETNVIKPMAEKETGKPYEQKGGYLDIYLNSEPNVKRAWETLQSQMQTVRKNYVAHAKKEKAND
jgi:hypothetical protein